MSEVVPDDGIYLDYNRDRKAGFGVYKTQEERFDGRVVWNSTSRHCNRRLGEDSRGHDIWYRNVTPLTVRVRYVERPDPLDPDKRIKVRMEEQGYYSRCSTCDPNRKFSRFDEVKY